MTFRLSKKVMLLLAVAALGSAGFVYYVFKPQVSIDDYSIPRDKKFILSLFDSDWYWLSGYSRDEADTDLFLEKMSPMGEPRYAGKLIIKVMHVDKQPVGFVAYYMKTFYEGIVLFIDVAHSLRKKKYGKALLEYAVEALAKQGAGVVRLVTRTENIPAQKLYKSVGFREYLRDTTYVFFEKRIK